MQTILEVKGISKRFPGVLALDDVDFSLARGEVHALLGENGAGKSTLVKIITGAYKKDAGKIYIENKAVEFHNPVEACDAGIGTIFQEFSQVNTLSVAENIFLGDYPKKYGCIDWRTLNKSTEEILNKFDINVKPTDKLITLGVATRQMIEILKVIRRLDLKILVMDEPTSALTINEVDTLFNFIKTVKNNGVSVIYISHRLDEIKRICDKATIFRNGKKIITIDVIDVTIDDIVSYMVGQELKDHYPPKTVPDNTKSIEIKNFSGNGFKNITFAAYKGEVLGITGLIGAGKSELLETLFGARKKKSGTVTIYNKSIEINKTRDAIKNGIGLIPENRKEQGLILCLSNLFNMSMASLERISKPFLKLKEEIKIGKRLIKELQVRPIFPYWIVKNLSGGNQQKIVIGKWLMRDCNILLFDEPTRGIDVGAKFQIYSLITGLAKQGKTIIVASCEIEEITGICNRAFIIKNGHIIAECDQKNLKKDKVIAIMNGVENNEE